MLVHTVKDTKKDSLTTAASRKSTHGSDAAAHLDEQAFDDVGSAQPFPMDFRAVKEGQ
jgi:hypothetical protein